MTRRLVSTPAGWALVAAAASFAGGISAAWFLRPPVSQTGLPALGVITAAALVAAVRRRLGAPGMTIAVVLLTAALGLLRGASAVHTPGPGTVDGHAGMGAVALVGTVRAIDAGRGSDLVVDVDHLVDAAGEAPVRGGVLVTPRTGDQVLPGDEVRVDAAALRLPAPRAGARSADLLEREGVTATATGASVTLVSSGFPLAPARLLTEARTALAAAVRGILPEPVAGVTVRVAFGIRESLPSDVSASLQSAGLIHLVAVSGLKVAIVVGLLGRLAALLALSPRVRIGLVLAGSAVYVAMSGGGAAAVRSGLMAGAALLVAQGGGRRVDSLPLLALTAAVMLGLDPALCADVGFQLSFLGTLGILLLADPLIRRLPGPRLLVEPFAVTVAAQVATVPVMSATFGTLSLVGPVANALVLPALPLFLVLALTGALAALIAAPLGALLLQPAGLLVSAMLALARGIGHVPAAAIDTRSWPHAWLALEALATAAGAIVVLGGRTTGLGEPAPNSTSALAALGAPPRFTTTWRPSRRGVLAAGAAGSLLVAVSVMAVAARPDGRMHLSVLDVGAATAVLVRTPAGGLVLVDAGSDPRRLDDALGADLPPTTHTIDLLVLTGGERSATAGLAGLPGHYRVSRAMVPATDLPRAAGGVLLQLRDAGTEIDNVPVGAAWSWGGASWRCLPAAIPDAGASSAGVCALQVAIPGTMALILGDMSTATQEELAGAQAAALASQLLVAAPGGALAPSLVEAVRPERVAVPDARTSRTAWADIPGSSVELRQTGADGTLHFASTAAGWEPA